MEYVVFGTDHDPEALRQIERACRLPVSVRGALMPDAHVGYGLPIGGVLASLGAVIPYAVGVDIACRMRMSVLDLPLDWLERKEHRLKQAILDETRFGIGAQFKRRRNHPVMDQDWNVSRITREVRDIAWAQLGTSGSGNHFVEFGVLEVLGPGLGLEPGSRFLAFLSHSGSRRPGNLVAAHYSRVAMQVHPGLPKEARHLAWLDLESSEGKEYWAAMQLMGRYAAANHELIHRHVLANLGATVLASVENHHNFAWIERHGGRDVVVHRKGAVPAGKGVMAVIPGSMASPGFVVAGKGERESLMSAAHGAGRAMSRKEAKRRFTMRELKNVLAQKGVRLMSAGLDEAPMAYKDIGKVMQAQERLVDIVARFQPVIVRMAPGNERPED